RMPVSVRRFPATSKMHDCGRKRAFAPRRGPAAIDSRRIGAVKIRGCCFVAIASKEPGGMEARIARLESDVAHVRSDVAELKTDLRSVRDRIDRLVESLAAAKIWALVLYIALAGGL